MNVITNEYDEADVEYDFNVVGHIEKVLMAVMDKLQYLKHCANRTA